MRKLRLLFVEDEPGVVEPLIESLDRTRYECKTMGFEEAKNDIQTFISSSIMKCNTWGSRKVSASLSVYVQTV